MEVGSDLLAAAPLWDSPALLVFWGLVPTCLYDGKGIVKSISPLGLSWEMRESGAALGKLLVGDVLKNQLPAALQEAFGRSPV